MFDLGWTELLLVAVVALIVVGPKDLPGVLRTVTGLMRRARSLTRDFQRSLEDMARETGVDELKRDIQKATRGDPADDGLDDIFSRPPDFTDNDKGEATPGNSILDPATTADKGDAQGPEARGNGATDPATPSAPAAATPTAGPAPLSVAERHEAAAKKKTAARKKATAKKRAAASKEAAATEKKPAVKPVSATGTVSEAAPAAPREADAKPQ